MVASAVIRAAADLLQRAQGFADERLAKLIGSAQIFSVLLPMVVAYISPVAAIDPRVRRKSSTEIMVVYDLI